MQQSIDTHSVTYLTEPLKEFEEEYKNVRKKEGRWLTDDEVKSLPDVRAEHPLAQEWRMRKWMLMQFSDYLADKKPKNVLDIGCGNGWMTNRLSRYCAKITGLDVGEEELEQAARCFGSEVVNFVCSTDWSLLPKNHFDIIYFAGSLHYFEPDKEFWEEIMRMLTPKGEIHILETSFYSEQEIGLAKMRTDDYYKRMNANVNYYKHLHWEVLPENRDFMYRPGILQRFFRGRSPFPWIRIRKEENTPVQMP